jgi:chromosomal replication initiator protein
MSKRSLSFSRLLDLPENQSALLAFKSLADSVASGCRPSAVPLYLFGPHGTGKSILIKTLEAEVFRRCGRAVVASIPAKELGDFLNAYSGDGGENSRPIDDFDLLVIEDLQHLPSRLDHSLCELIDDFSARQVPLVCTASVSPQQLPFTGRLITRLASGLVVGIEKWKESSRLKFLEAKAQERQLAVNREIMDWLATNFRGSGRELDGVLNRLDALSALHNGPLALTDVAGHFQAELEATKPTVNRILARVSELFRVPASLLVSNRRTRSVLLPRQVSMYLTRRLTDLSLQEIGKCFGRRDHSTVLHACRKVAAALRQDSFLAGTVHQLEANLT